MISKKPLKTFSSVLLSGVFAFIAFSPNAMAVKQNYSEEADSNSVVQCMSYVSVNERSSSHIDLGIANEEKIIEMLKKEGKISEDATIEEAHEAYVNYMKTAPVNDKETKEEKKLNGRENKHAKDKLLKKAGGDQDEKKTEINVLVVLAEYSDFKHNSILQGETDMYYKSYERQHFQDMLFGDNGYTGPNGENLVSMKQYYEQQSGGTFIINGTVTDWYTLPENAAFYGYDVGGVRGNDANPRQMVRDALNEVGKDESIDLSQFDKLDRYDLDGDGDYNEPDGMIDYLVVIHAGVGQEAGGGQLGSDAVWSHSWSLGGLYSIPGTSYTDENGNERPYYAYKYTTDPEDGAAGVFCHEFGHEIGLPDEYDTQYSSDSSEPISYWSVMSSGSWAGAIPGAEPPGFSPYGRQILQELYDGKWQDLTTIDYEDLNNRGLTEYLNSAAKTGEALRINLPDLNIRITQPTSGQYAYYGGKGVDGYPIDNNMVANVDLTNASAPMLNFKTWYDIEYGWDFASVSVKEEGSDQWICIPGNITTTDRDPDAEVKVDYGITGTSDGWVDAQFDLSEFAGKNMEIMFKYQTDTYTFGQGIYIDDIAVTDGSDVLFNDDAESEGALVLDGFTRNTGVETAGNYYLIEWRDHSGVDNGLAHINSYSTNGDLISYDTGMVVWYVNEFYTDNWNAYHPGYGYLSIVDADQNNIMWMFEDQSTMFASNKYQMHDAAFHKDKSSTFNIDFTDIYGRIIFDDNNKSYPKFMDSTDYSNSEIPTLGVRLPKLGIDIQVTKEAKNKSGANVKITRSKNNGKGHDNGKGHGKGKGRGNERKMIYGYDE